ncbi:hypothetical protein RND81_10G012500 [Saponaria officinalis]|uniref:Secreted protein n=1 Tax=Saponaria officinalis TaxID=3572 RepID=A0AAW1HZ07_SAPOF
MPMLMLMLPLPSSASSSHRKVGDHSNVVDRPKFLGFVGIQTSFGSVDRRDALQSNWFAPSPDCLLRQMHQFMPLKTLKTQKR